MEQQYQPSWDFYLITMDDDNPGSFYLDMGLMKIAPVKNKSFLLKLNIVLTDPTPEGLSSNAESERLFQIEDALTDGLGKKLGAVYAGRTTISGEREFYYYFTENDSASEVVDGIMAQFPEYEFLTGLTSDPEWSEYKDFLYPGAEELRPIVNRRVIKNLSDQGDSLTASRKVDHWIYFEDEDSRDDFEKEILKEGFQTDSKNYLPEYENPYSIMVWREEIPDEENMNSTTSFLVELAEDNDGIYDGWGTEVVT
jgi:regulator of RNase E activity RraB